MGCKLLSWEPTAQSRLGNRYFSLKILSPVPILSLELVARASHNMTPQSNLQSKGAAGGICLLVLIPQQCKRRGEVLSLHICWLKSG